jgi:endonuclease YncB( thermonuclease family)
MSHLATTQTYTALVNDIAELYNRARHALVEAYWQIGKRIVEQEQRGDHKAEYGIGLLERLSEDLQQTLGKGFSVRNLRNMRRFYLSNPIRQTSAELTWSQHVELLPVTSKAGKRRLEKRIIRDKLSPRQIRQEVRLIEKDRHPPAQDKTPVTLPPPSREPPLQCFEVIGTDRADCSKGMVIVDCGFNIWREISRQDAASHACPQGGKPSYTYPAQVESVIDGDTLWVIVDCGDGIRTRQKIRLHMVDAPERGTPEGDRATRFVKRVMRRSQDIVIRTHHYDKYTRYLADIFYLPETSNPKTIYAQGTYLNQQLLDKGLAQAWKP